MEGSFVTCVLVVWFPSLGQVEDYGTIITSHNPLLGPVKCLWANNSYFLYSFLVWTNIVTKYRTYGLCYLKLISRGACGH